MKFLQLIILALSLLLVKADDRNDHCYNDDSCTPKCAIPIKNCCDVRIYPPARVQSGVYKMNTGPFCTANIYCDMTTADGGWIVIQRNSKDSLVSFNRNWREYENGFGDLCGDFWYGLEAIHDFTKYGQWEMRVDFKKEDGSLSYIHYNQFKVGSASEEYKLTVGGYIGGGGDYFSGIAPPNGRMFSTLDNDNDLWGRNCADVYGGGWWFHSCYNINPNAQPPHYNYPNIAINIEVKIRPKNCVVE
ncbi:fibrinogen-like protein A [Dysidea avara]|uniref:fibrinogen-like protein A n=1 Tax=Dysidea avara TaxID=196820 RepID=UPI0033238528